MKTTIVLLLLAGISVLSYPQALHQGKVASEENMLRIRSDRGTVFTTNMDELYEGVKGTPYLFDDWKPGNVYLNDSDTIKYVDLKFNIYTDDLLYLSSATGDSLIIKRSVINKFELFDNASDKLIVMEEMNLKQGKSDKKTFARVIYSGKSKFVLKYIKTFIKAFYEGPYAHGNKYDEFTDKQQYYLITGENTIHKIKLNKKSVIKALSRKEKAVKKFVNEQDLSLDNEDDVAQVLEYYDTLTD